MFQYCKRWPRNNYLITSTEMNLALYSKCDINKDKVIDNKKLATITIKNQAVACHC